FYIHEVLPRIGAFLSGAREYRYLERSIADFPPPEVFASIMESAGIDVLQRRSFALGSAVLFTGESRGRGGPGCPPFRPARSCSRRRARPGANRARTGSSPARARCSAGCATPESPTSS